MLFRQMFAGMENFVGEIAEQQRSAEKGSDIGIPMAQRPIGRQVDRREDDDLPDVLAKLQATAPRLVLSVQPDNADTLVKHLRTGELDLAIDYLHFDDDDLHYQPLREEELAVIACANHPEIKGRLTLSQYQNCHHVSVHPRAGRGAPLEIVLGSAKVQRKVQLLVPHYLAIPSIVAHSHLLGTVPRPLAEHFAQQYSLQILSIPIAMAPVQVSLIWHKQQNAAVGLKWLREQIVSVAKAR